ncbi:hypothetical protein SK571_37820 [Lentzea sp. BCCO 10_0798]|uniref:Uncharacterized protein n=1 Tax=Lentzea kristufekii TaxID=3095430 RepID=A0ABU4U3L3_9PSEU|nr:hypothetical protein [Lentzea sp. BCCO 10_0798]MDX8055164.1 hypothetical protein [Lentzea sp. BCCO 10_0798]
MVEVEQVSHQIRGCRTVHPHAFTARQAIVNESGLAVYLTDVEPRRGVGQLAQQTNLSVVLLCLLPRHPHPDMIAQVFE